MITRTLTGRTQLRKHWFGFVLYVEWLTEFDGQSFTKWKKATYSDIADLKLRGIVSMIKLL